MELKELNSVAELQNLVGKSFAGAMVGQVIDGSFAELIGQTSENMLQGAEVDVKENTAKSLKVEDRNVKTPEEPTAAKKYKKTKKENAVSKDSAQEVKAGKVKENREDVVAPVVAHQEVVRPEAKKVDVECNDGVITADTYLKEPNVSLSDVVPHNIDVELPSVELSKEIPAGESAAVISSQVGVVNLNHTHTANVFDVVNEGIVQMAGSEPSEVVEQVYRQDNLFVAAEEVGESVYQLMPTEVVEDVVRNFSYTLSQNTASESLGMKPMADEVLLEQAKMLDSKLEYGHKISVNVSVEGEDFSYVDASELVQDKVVLSELIDAQGEVKAPENKAVLSNTMSVQVASGGNEQTSQVQNPFAVASGVNADIQPSVESTKVVAVEGITSSSSGGGSSCALSGVTTAHGETPAAGNTNKTTFRDVFKGMSKEVVEQVKVNITKSAIKGVDNIDIRLKPEELGSIEIKMQISKDGKLQAHIVASRPETVEILQKEVQSLEKAFNDAGFEMEDGALSFSFREGGESNREQENDSGLRNFIGKALENESVEDMVGNDNQVWSSTQGLNIRV